MYSVVIPVYESKKDLKRCVRSWLSQTEQALEIILVDDGSTDGSADLCDMMAKEDRRVRVIHQKNSGVSAARNAGILAAKGEFLLFTDSDDYVAKDYLEKMGTFQQETNSDFVLCGFHHLYDGADILKVPKESKIFEIQDFSEAFLELYEKSYLNMPWNKMFRKNMAGVFDTSLSLGEDLLFNLDYLRKCKRIGVLAEPLCYYIQEEQKVTLSSKKRQNRMELARKICEETERFYDGLLVSRGIPVDSQQAIDGHARIFTRYMNEIMDECEKLPMNKELSIRDKLQIIRTYSNDEWVQSRGEEAKFFYRDYQILWFFLKRHMAGMVYILCVLRRVIVVIVHKIRRGRS